MKETMNQADLIRYYCSDEGLTTKMSTIDLLRIADTLDLMAEALQGSGEDTEQAINAYNRKDMFS